MWYQENCSHFNQFTLQDEDACLIAYMRHEDGSIIYFLSDWCFKVNKSLPFYNCPGHFYTRQKCINSTIEAPFYRGHGGILQPYCRSSWVIIIINAKLGNILVYHESIKVLNVSENIKLQRLAFGGHLPLCLWLLRV